MRPRGPWLTGVLLIASLAGCAGGSFTILDRTFELSPGQFAEVNLQMAEGDTIEVSFATDGPEMRWDLHRHGGDQQVEILEEGNASQGTVTYTADRDGVVSAFWEPHEEVEIRLEVTITGEAEVVSLVPRQP